MPSVRVPKPPLSRPRLPPLYFGHPSGCGFCYASTMAPENGHEAVIAPVRLAVFLCLRSPPGAWIIQDPLGGNTPAVFVRFSGTRRPSCATTKTLRRPFLPEWYWACLRASPIGGLADTARLKAVCSEVKMKPIHTHSRSYRGPVVGIRGRFRARGAWSDLGPPARGGSAARSQAEVRWRPLPTIPGILDVVGPRTDGRLIVASQAGLILAEARQPAHTFRARPGGLRAGHRRELHRHWPASVGCPQPAARSAETTSMPSTRQRETPAFI